MLLKYHKIKTGKLTPDLHQQLTNSVSTKIVHGGLHAVGYSGKVTIIKLLFSNNGKHGNGTLTTEIM